MTRRPRGLLSAYALGEEYAEGLDGGFGNFFRDIGRSISRAPNMFGRLVSQGIRDVGSGARSFAGGVRTVATQGAQALKYANPALLVSSYLALAPVARTFQSQAARKIARYAGATLFVATGVGAFMGKERNRMFGLKGEEIKWGDIGAKAYKYIMVMNAIPVLVVAGGPAVAALCVTAGAYYSKDFIQSMMTDVSDTKAGGALIKDTVGRALIYVTQDVAGKILGQKYNAEQMPDVYEEMPNDGWPVPIPYSSPEDAMTAPARVAGSETLMPDDTVTPPIYEGELFSAQGILRAVGNIAQDESLKDILARRAGIEHGLDAEERLCRWGKADRGQARSLGDILKEARR